MLCCKEVHVATFGGRMHQLLVAGFISKKCL